MSVQLKIHLVFFVCESLCLEISFFILGSDNTVWKGVKGVSFDS